MRKDMKKVLCEEPRHGWRTKDRKGRKRAERKIIDEEKPVKEQGNLQRKWLYDWHDHKNFGEHIQPLRRYILSCLGRSWDDVYSEICKIVPKGSVVNNHLYTHLYQFIAVNTYFDENGRVCDMNMEGYPIYQEVFVHPNTGIITATPKKAARKQKAKPKNLYKINDDTVYKKDDKGIWWKCFLTTTPPPVPDNVRIGKMVLYTKRYPVIYDNFLKKYVHESDELYKTYGYNNKCCACKLQISKAEIKKLRKLLELA
jgi:hypothetical protein